ncbi:hypothetical protein K457DRAFT_20717 [Linnemannia elongata AG-77]|uniref:Ndc10 domain-containing protein n=1 Tax=Linnemannia elongata AG-77 TaxID=1314771 RepID=A0A197JRA4_9FUNG|nr:hypothetical protein K457DRAFT_20717 [Linnemannia elongata AG-77]
MSDKFIKPSHYKSSQDKAAALQRTVEWEKQQGIAEAEAQTPGGTIEAASSDTIGRHITKVSDLLPLPPGMEKAPSGRSLGSSLAIEHGATSDEVQAQGFWAHSATYESFYRLSRRSVKNLTHVTLAG